MRAKRGAIKLDIVMYMEFLTFRPLFPPSKKAHQAAQKNANGRRD
jgi:hypothetical protein